MAATPTGGDTQFRLIANSGDPSIDALIGGFKWGSGGPGSGVALTYSFPSGTAWFIPGYTEFSTYDAFTAAQQSEGRAALQAWANVANITFTEVTDGQFLVGDLRLARFNGSASESAHAYFPGGTYSVATGIGTANPRSGDIWIDYNDVSNLNPTPGTFGYTTLLHEVGHALGLKHSFEGDTTLPPSQDSYQYTVMSYTVGSYGMPTTPMLYDILAIQHMYGANMSYRTGDDNYSFSSGEVLTIWDAGGVDSISGSGTIDLQQGGFSQIDGAKVAIAFGTTIENATGGNGPDLIYGNDVANSLQGGGGNDTIYGFAGDDEIAGGDGNDHLEGGTGNDRFDWDPANRAGADAFLGGAGDDVYVISGNDQVVENSAEGTDLVWADANFSIEFVSNIENLSLFGTDPVSATGNTLDNIITGNSGNNTLIGGEGNDTLDGGIGFDWMWGGAGDDIYLVGVGDTVVENANEGNDRVDSDVTWTLGVNVENLTLTGLGAINGTGNALDNTLTGNSGNNALNGGAGADTMLGGAGDDVYTVDHVGDSVVEQANEGVDLVSSSLTYSLGANIEKLTLTGTGAINGTGNSLNNTLTGNSAANVLTGGAGNDIYYAGVGDTMVEAVNEGTDLVYSTIAWTLGANLENLTFYGSAAVNGTGNSLNNTLTGNSAANVLAGATGDDIYVVGVGDTVVEQANEGVDLVQSVVSWTLETNLEKLTLTGIGAINGTGNSLNNILTGNSAANVLMGGVGDDIYVVSVGDTVVENANEGVDLVQSAVSWTLGANLEKLTLTGTGAINGTGNSLSNILTGNSTANVLTGGVGNDIYYAGVGDTMVEAVNEGTDLVYSTIAWTLGANLENLTFYGSAAVNGTGNSLNNTLTGNSAANLLTGGTGNDTLSGGLGNDTYRVDRGEGQDRISENDGTIGNSDGLLYGATINPFDLVLSRQVNDLRLAIHGSTDSVTIQNWFSTPTTAQVETIQAGNGQTLLSLHVDQLIQAMASFSQQTGLSWDQAIDQQPQNVQAVLAASWQ